MSKFQKIIKNSEQTFLLTFTFFTHKNHQNSLWIIFFEKLKKALEISERNFDAMCALCEETFEKIDHHASTNSCSKNLGSAMSLLVMGILMKCEKDGKAVSKI